MEEADQILERWTKKEDIDSPEIIDFGREKKINCKYFGEPD